MEPPPKSEEQYFLLAQPISSSNTTSTPQRLRFHSSTHPILILHPDTPKLIRFHTELSSYPKPQTGAQIIATSHAARHAGRSWALSLHLTNAESPRGWEEVHMLEGQGDAGFSWRIVDGVEELVFESEDAKDGKWAGWMVCQWSMGHKQLFWVTEQGIKDLPSFCERVRIVKEGVWGQPGTSDKEVKHSGAGS